MNSVLSISPFAIGQFRFHFATYIARCTSLMVIIIICVSGSTNFVEISTDHNEKLVSFGLTGRIVNGTKAALKQFPHQVIFIGVFNLTQM